MVLCYYFLIKPSSSVIPRRQQWQQRHHEHEQRHLRGQVGREQQPEHLLQPRGRGDVAGRRLRGDLSGVNPGLIWFGSEFFFLLLSGNLSAAKLKQSNSETPPRVVSVQGAMV